MTLLKQAFVLVNLVAIALGQRGSFAGFRPIGYPEISTTSNTQATDELGNRFGDDNTTSTTTQRLPIEANGDRDLVDRLSKLPIDQQPFWFINWQAIEANRKNPQTYPQRPSQFAGSQAQSQIDIGDSNRNTADLGISSGATPPKTGGNRDVNVASFLANNNRSPSVSSNSINNAGRPTSKPMSNDLNANDDILGNRFGNEPTENTKPASPPVRPTQNAFVSSPAGASPTNPSLIPSNPTQYGQVVESFQSMPFKPFSTQTSNPRL